MSHIRAFAFITVALLSAGVLAGCAEPSSSDDPPATTSTPQTSPASQTTPRATTTPTPASTSTTTYKVDGSSTVYPIAQAWAEEYPTIDRQARFSVAFSGTGGGFQKFCRGETDISDASRPIKQSETDACVAAGIQPFEVQVAIDALAIVVSKDNTWMNNITTDEIYRIWTANGTSSLPKANRWNELRPEWPDQPIVLFGPGTDSGTFDYFTEVVTIPKDGAQGKGRGDYTKSEDDNTLVTGIASSQYAFGYFGLAYVHENADKVRSVPVDQLKGNGAIAPTAANVEAGKYTPFARPLFMYVNDKPTGTMQKFLQWGVGDEGQALVEEVGYIVLPAAKQQEMIAKLA